jgi:uncharacterized protein DUF5686
MCGALAPPAGLLLILAASATGGAAQSGTDSSAQLIITHAIARRRATLADIRQCRYAAFVKVVARDLGQPQDSARSVLLLAAVSSSAYWEHPDRYQETIEARHRAADAGIGRELVSVRDIVHLRWDRIELEAGAAASPVGAAPSGTRLGRDRAGGSRYSIISPIASDALDHYAYAVRDTLLIDGRRIFRVAIQPRSDAAPLFTGNLDIADSTFDVVAMNLGVTSAVRFAGVSHLRYEERLSEVDSGRWMPDEIRLTGELRRRISARWLPKTLAGVRLPEFPRQVSFEQVASLSGYRFDAGLRPPDLAEYRAVVRNEADQADGGAWSAPGAVPLTDAERAVWVSRDSADQHPGLVPRLTRDLDAVQRAVLGPGSFHFNRVDGTYLGVAPRWPASPSLQVSTKIGRALGSDVWQYRVGVHIAVSTHHRIWLGAAYHDETVPWPALATGGYDPTASALIGRGDPNNYYRERGVTLSLGAKLIDFTRLELRYDDVRQSSQDTIAGAGFHTTRLTPLPNPPIEDGHLRSLSVGLTYDSRQLIRNRGVDYRLRGTDWTRVTVAAQIAAPGLIPNDFAFRRYTFQLEHQQRTRALGITTITLAGGVAGHGAPPQRYFTVGFGRQLFAAEGVGFNTLAHTQYAGNRALMLSVRQDVGRRLFWGSGPSLSLRAGVFWSTLVGQVPTPADTMLTTAPRPYGEAGFTLGNLTPFLSPFDLAVSFTWQLSSYPTQGFRFGFGVTGP